MSALKMDLTLPNFLGISWHDSAWVNVLDSSNVLEYFSDRSNPFYDRTCNNETVKMQRLDPEVMNDMTGLEYILLHVQDPILFVIRKQHRHSRNQVTPLADYYVLAGIVYQAPDLNSVLNSRLLSTVYHLQGAFDLAYSFNRYHSSKGYWWDFGREDDKKAAAKKRKEARDKEDANRGQKEAVSMFQRRRVDLLLNELTRRYPPKLPSPPAQAILHHQHQQPQGGVFAAAAGSNNATASGAHQQLLSSTHQQQLMGQTSGTHNGASAPNAIITSGEPSVSACHHVGAEAVAAVTGNGVASAASASNGQPGSLQGSHLSVGLAGVGGCGGAGVGTAIVSNHKSNSAMSTTARSAPNANDDSSSGGNASSHCEKKPRLV